MFPGRPPAAWNATNRKPILEAMSRSGFAACPQGALAARPPGAGNRTSIELVEAGKVMRPPLLSIEEIQAPMA